MKVFNLGSARIKPGIVLLISLLFIGLSLQVFSQRVGIGTTQPLARLAIDSGLMVDQLSANMGLLSPGVIFGHEGLIGISSSRLNGSAYRNGLSFYTNGSRRMSIDSVGNVGIGTSPSQGYRLYVSGSALVTGNLEVANQLEAYNLFVNNRLILNTADPQDALLYLKGRCCTPDNWGMHIVMESTNSTATGAILFDGHMKFRVFAPGAGYFFRDENNSTIMSISSTGAITAEGRGMVQSNNTNQLQLIQHATPANLNFTIGPGGSVSFGIAFTAFTSAPNIAPANWTGVTDASHLNSTAIDITTNSATIVVRNVGTATVTGTNARLYSIIAGVRN